jgi:putative acyl-CoA dehydrogenase
LRDLDQAERRARRIVEVLALALQGSLVIRHGHPSVADAFCASRLERGYGGGGWAFGTLPSGVDTGTIIERARPKVA